MKALIFTHKHPSREIVRGLTTIGGRPTVTRSLVYAATKTAVETHVGNVRGSTNVDIRRRWDTGGR